MTRNLQKGTGIGMKEIGEIICQYRQNKKMTQEEFASRLGVTAQAVSKWERGNGLPDISLVKGICRILDISPGVLLGIAKGKVVENSNAVMEQEIKNNLFAEPLLLEVGEELISCVVTGLESDYVNQKRKELVKARGILMPVLRIRDNTELKKSSYRILSYDRVLWEDCLEAKDEAAFREMIDTVAGLCEENYGEIINKHTVKIMIDNIREFFPGIVEGLVPERISYLRILRKMQEILNRKGSIRDIIHILEELEENLESRENG